MNNSVFPEEDKGVILQIAPLPDDATVVVACYADGTSEYYPYLYDVREQGGAGFLALTEYKGIRDVSVKATSIWGGYEDAQIVPTVYCPNCKTRMFAHARNCIDAQEAIMRDNDQNWHLMYRCPTCRAEHVWRRPFSTRFDDKDVVEKDGETLEALGWTDMGERIYDRD